MAGKKRFIHPQLDHPLIQALERIEDMRDPSIFFRYSLTSVLFMVLIGTACGAQNFAGIVRISKGIADWLAKYVDMSRGIPCERTFKNMVGSVHPRLLEGALREVIQDFGGEEVEKEEMDEMSEALAALDTRQILQKLDRCLQRMVNPDLVS